MSSRDFLNQNSSSFTIALLVVLVLSIGFVAWWIAPREPAEKTRMAHFYDLNTNERFVAPINSVVPIERDSGPYQGMHAGVRAHVYSCGPMVKGAETFVHYLSIPTDAVLPEHRPAGVEPSEETEEFDTLIRRPEDDVWVLESGPGGKKIREELRNRCGDKSYTSVTPPPGIKKD